MASRDIIAVVTTGTDADITSGKGCFISSIILAPAAAACSVTVYDALTATGDGVKLTAAADGGSVQFNPPGSLKHNTGLTVVVAGAGAVATILGVTRA